MFRRRGRAPRRGGEEESDATKSGEALPVTSECVEAVGQGAMPMGSMDTPWGLDRFAGSAEPMAEEG